MSQETVSDKRYIGTSQGIHTWHRDQDCPSVTGSELTAARPDEIPPNATPCSHCAGGISAYDLRADSA